jgi:hypothetical protein
LTLRAPANALALSPDGARVAVSRTSYNPLDTQACVVELSTGAVTRSASLGIASTAAVAFTGPDRARVASARDTSIAVQEIG